jgi:hypothetical protein
MPWRRRVVFEGARIGRKAVRHRLGQREVPAGLTPRKKPLPKEGLVRGAQQLQTLEGEEEVRSALGGNHGVDLVHDDRVHRAKQFARGECEQEVERLGGRDENVRRSPRHPGAVGERGVARPDRDRRDPEGLPLGSRRGRDAGDRRAQVSLDVHGERLQRRHVEHAAPLVLRRLRREHEPVDRCQKCSQRLSRTSRSEEQGRAARDDRRPALRLSGRGRREGGLEPAPYGGPEEIQRTGPSRHPGILESRETCHAGIKKTQSLLTSVRKK